MSTPTIDSGIRDNYVRGTVADFLKVNIGDDSRLAVMSAFFTLHAYAALKGWLDRIDHMDFLFGDPKFVGSLDPDRTEAKAFIIDSTGLSLANVLHQKRVARECAEWIRGKVDIKSIKQSGFLHGKMFHIANGPVEHAIVGSSNFTIRGLGLSVGIGNIELNLVQRHP